MIACAGEVFEDDCMRRGGLLDPVGNGGCPPRCGDCAVEIGEFCVPLHVGDARGGGGG